MEKNDFQAQQKKFIISRVNYRALHSNGTLRPASGVRPETKPLLREPNNYIERASPIFSSFSVVRPTQFFGIIKKKKKEKKREKETTKLILFYLN